VANASSKLTAPSSKSPDAKSCQATNFQGPQGAYSKAPAFWNAIGAKVRLDNDGMKLAGNWQFDITLQGSRFLGHHWARRMFSGGRHSRMPGFGLFENSF